MSDEAGVTRRLIDYDSFGVTLSDSDPALDVVLGFAGGLQDADTGLVHFGARDYDPETGRWTSVDPIGLSGGDVNLYGYCLSDPVGLVDPAGLLSSLDTPEGQAVMYEVLFEIASSAADVADVATTLSDCGSSGFDKLVSVDGAVAGAVLPGGGYSKVDDAVRLAGRADDAAGLVGRIGTYDELRKLTRGTGLEVHHLVEKRFASWMEQKPGEMLSMIVTKADHQPLTNAWRGEIGYGEFGTYAVESADEVWAAARAVYADHPEILRALGL